MTNRKNNQALVVFFDDQNRDRVESFLASNLTDEQKSGLYRAFIEDTITNCLDLGDIEIRIHYVPGRTGEIVNDIVGKLSESVTGKPLKMLQSDRFRMCESEGLSRGERISNAFKAAFGDGLAKVVLIGCVTPTLQKSTIMDAFARISEHDLVIGPTLEGNCYLLAMRRNIPDLLVGIDWSDDSTVYSQMTTVCRDRSIDWDEMDLWYDLRQPEDLEYLVRDINHFRLVGDEQSAMRTEQALEQILKNLPS
jgi:glycosyltransferase A (GT-A) superfamily protein (DUF2064 family)